MDAAIVHSLRDIGEELKQISGSLKKISSALEGKSSAEGVDAKKLAEAISQKLDEAVKKKALFP